MDSNELELAVGTVLSGRYEIRGRIGAGGMATVYHGIDNNLRRDVAIKIPHPALVADPEIRARFREEIGALTALDHANIVKIFDAAEHEGRPYAVVQYMAGGSLEALLRHEPNSPWPPEPLLSWLPYVTSALDFAHASGIIHRDVKPENVLFNEHRHVFLSDFGIVKVLTDDGGLASAQTRTGTTLGSPRYMAPEFVDRRFSPAYDQYSVAVIIYRALSGAYPHDADTTERLLIEKCTQPPAPLVEQGVLAPPAVCDVVMRGLAPEPSARFRTCTEFSQAFAAAVRGDAATVSAPIGGVFAPSGPEPGFAALDKPRTRRRASRFALAAALLLGVGVLLVDAPRDWMRGVRDLLTKPTPTIRVARVESSELIDGDETRERTANRIGETHANAPPPSLKVAGDQGLGESSAEDSGNESAARQIARVVQQVTVRIETVPADAGIMIDGTLVGRARAEGFSLPPGEHDIRVTRSGYLPYAVQLDLRAGETIQLEALLTEIATAEPEASPAASPARRADRIHVPASSFFYGCNTDTDRECRADEKPGRIIELDEFWIDRTEVTAKAYGQCVDAGACDVRGLDTPLDKAGRPDSKWRRACSFDKVGRSQEPINCISWDQAVSFCSWRAARLPTELEWEKAARGDQGHKFAWGDETEGRQVGNISDESARAIHRSWYYAKGYDDGFVEAAPVGSFPDGASPYGALDMTGNASEWTASWYDTSERERVVRGGSWLNQPSSSRVSFRHKLRPSARVAYVGFRCMSDEAP